MRRDPSVVVLGAVLAATLVAVTAHAAVHPTPEDVAALAVMDDPVISPDGRHVAYTLESATLDPGARPAAGDTRGGWTSERQLWLIDTAGGAPRRITTGPGRVEAPCWSPDGRTLAFVRHTEAPAEGRIELLSLEGGEPTPLATPGWDADHIQWAPDGAAIAFLAAAPPTAAEKDADWRSGGVTAWSERFRPQALWVVAADGGGAPRRVTHGTENVAAYAWSPDGRRFAVLTSPSADPYDVTLRLTPRIVAAADGAVLRTLDPAERLYAPPVWSPDGDRVALLTTRETLSMMNELEVVEVTSGRIASLSPTRDVTYTALRWGPDAGSLIVVVGDRTASRLERVDARTGDRAALDTADRMIEGAPSLDREGRHIVFLSSTESLPPAATLLDRSAGRARVLAEPNPQVRNWSLGESQVVHWRNGEGVELEGLLLRPHGSHGPVPLFVFPHGGPDAASLRTWSPLATFFAAHGYAVFRPNYRGSLDYGHDFYAANRGRFGAIESADIESGVDALVASGQADARQLFFGGWSWGGYLGAWTLTHQKRYRAIVVGAGVSDVVSLYATGDINHGLAAAWEYRGDPWRETDHFDRANPLRFVRDATTPTLILHGEADERVPFPIGVELDRALSDVGCPVAFYAYPREHHDFVEPAHRAHVARVWLDWFDRHRTGAAPDRMATARTSAVAPASGGGH